MQSLRFKLIAPFIFGTLALAVFLPLYTYTSAREAVKDATLLISEAKTNHAVSSMGLLIKSMSTSLQNMVVDPHVTSLFVDHDSSLTGNMDTDTWLEIITQSNEYYRDALVVDVNGICISSSNPGRIGNSYIALEYVKNALNGRFNLGDPAIGKVTKKFSVYGAGPIDVGGEVVGALIIINDFPKIVDYESQSEFDSQIIFTAMLDETGLFESHFDKNIMHNAKDLFPELYSELAEVGEKGGIVTYQLKGKSYIGYAKVEPTIKWLVITSGEEELVYASAYRTGSTVFGISFAILCLISLVVLRFSNGILRALLSLIDYAKHVSEGNLDLQLEDSHRKDELGILHSALQRLVESLQSMLKETQAASKMKGEFLANMSHEIRTPLNAILGMAHLSLRDPSLTDGQRGYLEKIQMAAKALLGIISDILDLSKIEAGKMELENVSFNLLDTLESVVSMHQEAAAAKVLELELKYDPNMEHYFNGDSLRITQVVNNLLSNAIKFTKEGGVSVSCWQDKNYSATSESGNPVQSVHISVKDDGIGMSEEAVQKLFQPFTQADASITRQYGGTGLGLAISHKLVDLLGGEISVTSELGKGTTFSFNCLLEVDPAGEEKERHTIPLDLAFEQLALQGKKLLIAEDNNINQLIMQELIEPSGADITMVENGKRAVETAVHGQFDLVFMDMQMPVMGGLEATRLIREFKSKAELPIIAVTANAMKQDKEDGFASGMNGYLTKPIEPDQLLSILKKWIRPE